MGGGKSTFVGLLTRILNPYRNVGPLPGWMAQLQLDDKDYWPAGFRRPWLVVNFNAWRHQHVSPPWWVFSESIRRQCLNAILHEKNQQTGVLPRPLWPWAYKRLDGRVLRWTAAWLRELSWRLSAPSMRLPALVSTAAFLVLFALYHYEVIAFDKGGLQSREGVGAFATVAITALVGGGTVFWTLFNLFARTLLPGTPEAAANYSLGAGDPLDRFRKHFARTIDSFRRPVIVAVDDLDRCEPGYVVELIRGMQTILVSPRIVFVLLGDRDWIEKAFSETHKSMNGIEIGPEHGFGSRFVEKAIQFSFVLPDIQPVMRRRYVRNILGIAGEPVTNLNLEPPKANSAELESALESVLAEEDYEAREKAAAGLRSAISAANLAEQQREDVLQQFALKLSLRAASDRSAERATGHMIEALAPLLPPNPRQIKRIVNAISLIQEAARLHGLANPGSPEWQVLARWVVLMTEWPRSWFTLSRYPGLADLVLEVSPKGELPAAGADGLAKRIGQSQPVMALLQFEDGSQGWPKRDIDSKEIEWLCRLIPPASGRLVEPLP